MVNYYENEENRNEEIEDECEKIVSARKSQPTERDFTILQLH
jgi:hypothetical protein